MDLDLNVARSVLSRYALDAPTIQGQITNGFVNENLLVEDARGERYVLRGHTRLTDRARLEFQLDFHRHLFGAGVPVAPIVESAGGGPIVVEQGVFWVLFEWIEGSDYDFEDVRQTRSAARALAAFHRAGDAFRPGKAPAPQVGQGSFWYERFRTAREQPALLTELFPEPELRDDLAYGCDWWRAFASEWPAERIAGLSSTWLHSDFHGRNVVFHGSQLAGLFDFDDVWFGPRVCDVAQGVFNFGRVTRGIGRPEGRRMRADFARAFLEAYVSEGPLASAELIAVQSIAKSVYPPNGIQLRWMKEHGLDYRTQFRRDVEITRQLDEEFNAIAGVFEGLPRA